MARCHDSSKWKVRPQGSCQPFWQPLCFLPVPSQQWQLSPPLTVWMTCLHSSIIVRAPTMLLVMSFMRDPEMMSFHHQLSSSRQTRSWNVTTKIHWCRLCQRSLLLGDRVRPLMGIRSREKLYRSANDCGKPAIKRNPKVLKNLNGKGPHGNGKTAEASS